jgi:uncharacterized protein (TIGR02001 family)
MKKTALIVAALAVAGVTYAADNVNVTAKPSYSVTSDFSYTSEYVFRGIKNSNAAFQGSVEVGQDDIRVGLWTSQPINAKRDTLVQYNNEIDFYAGYKVKLARDLTADFVGTYYYYPQATGGVTHHSYELGVGGTYDMAGMSPGLAGITTSLYAYYDFRLHQQTEQASVGYSIPLKDFGTSFDFSAFVGTASAGNAAPDAKDQPKVKESYNYYGIGLNVPYKLAENAQVHVGVSWSANDKYYRHGSEGLNPQTDWSPKQDIAVSAGITLGF